MLQTSYIIEKKLIYDNSYYTFKSVDKFQKYFFSFLEQIDTPINVYGIQDADIQKNKINVIVCVENCPRYKWYDHYNKYGDYGDDNVHLYIYNHIDRCVFDEKYISVPTIYVQLDYFKKYYSVIKPNTPKSFNEKKFCLIATSMSYDEKKIICSFLKSVGQCDDIADFKAIIGEESCYHSDKLMNLFNSYKFVFVGENSINDGYITEKIFNCYFSRTVPIYFGSKKIDYFFNSNSFINMNSFDFASACRFIDSIVNDEERYSGIINGNILNDYDDENYAEKVNKFIKKLADN